MIRNRLFLCICIAVTTLAISGCGSTSVTVKHDPLYRAVSHTSSITATARNSESGIDTIRILVTKGTMTDCTELGVPPSVLPCRQGATTVTHVCNFAGNPASATCTYSQNFGDQAMITYSAEAEGGGDAASTREITYAAGYPPTAGIARPIWWHRDRPSASQIDVGFFPDADYSGLYSTFTDDIQTIVDGAFFNDQEFSESYTLFRAYFNLWAAPFGADAEGCSRTFDSLVLPIEGVMDAEAIVHDANFRDCAAIAQGGAGSVWANAGDADWIFVHESGHFLHGQGDEYCCDGGYATSGTCQNVWSSQAACQSYASAIGLSPTLCVQIASGSTVTGAWRVDDGSLETMEDRTDNSNWQNTSNQCVNQRFAACSGGNCY